MLELARGLSPRALRALGDLERRTVHVDGGRLKLEWGVLNARAGQDVEDVLWWDGDRLLGFVGLYAFGSSAVEIAGMVDPATRRRGIATSLLDAALPICRERGHRQALLVVPRASTAGRALALSRGAALEHSEYALALVGEPADGPRDARITLRAATSADVEDISRLLTVAFGSAPADVLGLLASDSDRTLVAEMAGSAVGTLRLTVNDNVGGVYGFAVDPAWQGQGIGRDVLRRVCRQLRDDGAERIGLEVAVENERALGLYTSLGFVPVTTEDYYAVPLSSGMQP